MNFHYPPYCQRALLLTLVCVLLCGAARAQDAGVSGTVNDDSDAALAGATVTALNLSSSAETVATANESGAYEIKGLAAGLYRLTARARGFSALGVNVVLNAGDANKQDFKLTPGSLEDEITVSAAKSAQTTLEIPQTVTVATAEDIENRRPQGVHEIYERAPSVRTVDPNPYRARPEIRGLRSSRLLVLVDGERLNNARFSADFVGVSPSLIDVTEIQTTEVVGGPGSSLYGSDAVGGTISLTTKGPQRVLDGQRVDFKFTPEFNSNGRNKRGSISGTYGSKYFALRGNFSGFDFGNYNSGGEAINRADVTRFGQFLGAIGALAGQSVIASYTIYDLPKNWRVPFTGANGRAFNSDLMLFPTDKQTIRFKGQVNRFTNLDVPFGGPPTNANQTSTRFSDFDKFSGRYEIRELASWLPRLYASGYWQNYERALFEERYTILEQNAAAGVPSSSWANFRNPACPPLPAPCFIPAVAALTGNPSVFAQNFITDTTNRNKGRGFDVQGNFLPHSSLFYITGLNYNRDESRDAFATIAPVPQTGTKNTPDSNYKNLGWYNQLDWRPVSQMKLSGGFRVDNWKTEAVAGGGFPTPQVRGLVLYGLPFIRTAPGPVDVQGLTGLEQIAGGQADLATNNTVTTWNVAASFPTTAGVNPYVRYATSYREPDITSRYLLRTYVQLPFLALLQLTNTNLKPERGRNIDVGVKLDRQRYRASAAYYRNRLFDATTTATGSNCLPLNPAAGAIAPAPLPPCAATRTFLLQSVQFISAARVKLEGVELTGESSLGLGDAGSVTPFISFSTVRARNLTPDPTRLSVVRAFYNANAPFKLQGAEDDVPFYSLPNHQGTFAPRFVNKSGRWWAEYEYRWTSRITRIDPGDLSSTATAFYQTVRSYDGVQKHSLRGGFSLPIETPFKITMGLENFTNKLYFVPIQAAAAPGRSFVIGATIGVGKSF